MVDPSLDVDFGAIEFFIFGFCNLNRNDIEKRIVNITCCISF